MIWEEVQGIFQLATILYLPQDGRGEGLVGEELLDWVNAVDVGEYPVIAKKLSFIG